MNNRSKACKKSLRRSMSFSGVEHDWLRMKVRADAERGSEIAMGIAARMDKQAQREDAAEVLEMGSEAAE